MISMEVTNAVWLADAGVVPTSTGGTASLLRARTRTLGLPTFGAAPRALQQDNSMDSPLEGHRH